MKKYLLIIALFFVTNIWGQTSITFHVNDLLAGPANANWMFEFDDPGYRPYGFSVHDDNPFTQGPNILFNNFAYRIFTWTNST